MKFGNDQIAPILGYGDLVQGTITIKRVYYIEGLNHNLFFVGQFCDADLEVAFRKSTCYIRDLRENDLLTAFCTACFTQNRSLVIPRHEKTPYHIINAQKPLVKFFHIFGSLCYIVRDGENLDKMKEKGDACIFVRWRQITSVLTLTITTSNELELLYSSMFSELLNGTFHVVSKSSVVHAADNPDKRQHHNTTHTSATTDVVDPPPLNIHSTHQTPTQVPTVTALENNI
ncbi:hypothetical protein Tco_1244979 [Tanacetum coccineum]